MTQDSAETDLRQDHRATQRQKKDDLRRRMLRSMPKGGTVMEIGVWRGEFSDILLEELKPDRLLLVDPWERQDDDGKDASFAGLHSEDRMERVFRQVQDKFADEVATGRVSILRQYSVPVLEDMPPESLDFVYVDGDHSFDGVSADLEAVFPKLKVGGTVMLDDYHRRGWWKDGVIRAVNGFLGSRPDKLRVRAMSGAQIAISRIER